jgi:prepilin-type N-terminal cleavage/methylation domain-containing protein
MTRRGHTLIELLVSLTLIAGLSGSAAMLMASARRDDQTTQRGADDLRHVRRASDAIASAIRSAQRVEQDGESLITDGVRWSVVDSILERDGQRHVAGIARMTIAAPGPGMWTVGIAALPRDGALQRPLTITTTQRIGDAR